VDMVCSEVMRGADRWDEMERVQRNAMSPDRPSALVLAVLLGKDLPPFQMQRVHEAFAAALTHPIDEVRLYTSWSIDEAFWRRDRSLALTVVNAIATDAGFISSSWEAEATRAYDKRRPIDEIFAESAAMIRERFWQDGAIREDVHSTLDISEPVAAHSLTRMLIPLGRVPEDPVAIAAFSRVGETLSSWWRSDDDRKTRGRRDFHNEAAISERLEEFLLRTSPEAAREVLSPLLGAIGRHSREIGVIMQGLTAIQDRNPNTPQYWFLWGLFADAVKSAKWLTNLGGEYPEGSDLLSALFLTAYWKDNVRHWPHLEGYAHLVHSLFESLPATSIVLDYYVRFLYHIGEGCLPESFKRIAKVLRRSDARKMLERSGTVFLLEVLLQRWVYGRPLELKSERSVREAVLSILDDLVESGSSAAFRMRDDFVTPAA
jgi:hypothetical protein